MDKNPFSKKQESNNEFTPEMRSCVIDYANDISSLFLIYKTRGIESVTEILKEHTPRTFEEYRTDAGYTILKNPADMENPIFKEKISRIEELGKELKAGPLTKEKFEQIRDEVYKIIDRQ